MDKATKALAQRIASLEKIVHKLANAPPEQHEETRDDQGNTGQENLGAEPASGVVAPHIHPTPNKSKAAKEKWYRSAPRRILGFIKSNTARRILEAVGIIFAMGYAVVTYLQWRSIRERCLK